MLYVYSYEIEPRSAARWRMNKLCSNMMNYIKY
jgi:hypothetical protein